MTDAQSIARVVRSVADTLKRRGWSVSQSRSNKSLSRYVYAKKGKRSLKIRVSDHRPSKKRTSDINLYPKTYRQRRLASYLDARKHGARLRRKRPR